MLEGLPPNNAAYVMRLSCDEATARVVSDIIIETFDPADAAVAAFEETPTTKDWKGGPWLVEAYFGGPPDEDNLRALIAAVAGEDLSAHISFGRIDARDWVAWSAQPRRGARQ
jgi:ribosomal protein L11 methyltransferase